MGWISNHCTTRYYLRNLKLDVMVLPRQKASQQSDEEIHTLLSEQTLQSSYDVIVNSASITEELQGFL